jgi:predicted phage-related endonuclease
MEVLKLIQGTPEWDAHRATSFNASDAPAMFGCSPHKTRNELLFELHTGLIRDVSNYVQERVFDPGHRYEALARPLAEKIIGDDLYPITGKKVVLGLPLSASFDGLIAGRKVAFEHKTLNDDLRAIIDADCVGDMLPLLYQVQMEHQCIVSGCKRVFFMASEWDANDQLIEERHCWYESNPTLAGEII